MNYSGPTLRNRYELSPSARKYSAFATAAYDNIDNVKGYVLDKQLSTGQFKVYTKNDRLIFAVRGSKTPKDFLVSDVSVARGQEAIQMKETRSMFDKIMKKYPNKRKTAVGHSLSGLSVSRLKFEEGSNIENSYAFNPASSPYGGEQYKRYMRESYDQSNAHVIVKHGTAYFAQRATRPHWIRIQTAFPAVPITTAPTTTTPAPTAAPRTRTRRHLPCLTTLWMTLRP